MYPYAGGFHDGKGDLDVRAGDQGAFLCMPFPRIWLTLVRCPGCSFLRTGILDSWEMTVSIRSTCALL